MSMYILTHQHAYKCRFLQEGDGSKTAFLDGPPPERLCKPLVRCCKPLRACQLSISMPECIFVGYTLRVCGVPCAH